jgi:uncharacterized membrane protein
MIIQAIFEELLFKHVFTMQYTFGIISMLAGIILINLDKNSEITSIVVEVSPNQVTHEQVVRKAR